MSARGIFIGMIDMDRVASVVLLAVTNIALGLPLLVHAADKTDRAAVIDYSTWQSTTERPFGVARQQLSLCLPSDRAPDLGPHKRPALRIFANPLAQASLSKGAKTMPQGAAIVKEKWGDDSDRLLAYAAMIKRAPGYDSQHGDWEYVYVDLVQEPGVERGRLQSCIRCHSAAQRRDYLFGNHLQFEAKPTANRPARPSR
jgi:hypothetical protein